MNLCVLCMSHLFMTVTIVCSYSDKNPLKHIIEHTEFVTGNYIYLFKQGTVCKVTLVYESDHNAPTYIQFSGC